MYIGGGWTACHTTGANAAEFPGLVSSLSAAAPDYISLIFSASEY